MAFKLVGRTVCSVPGGGECISGTSLQTVRAHHTGWTFAVGRLASRLRALVQDSPHAPLLNRLSEIAGRLQSRVERKSLVLYYEMKRLAQGVATQRLRRSQQAASLYSQLWGRQALLSFLLRRRAGLLLGAACLVNKYDWEKERISDQQMQDYVKELEEVAVMERNTLLCDGCGLRKQFDQCLPDISYCTCGNPSYVKSDPDTGWEPFLERRNLTVWRKPMESKSDLTEYMVYGRYADISTMAFMQAQLDLEFRKEWDPSVLKLQEIERDHHSNTEVIYWSLKYPYPLANREYVYKRRWIVDRPKHTAVIVNEATTHSSCPPDSAQVQVKTYKSIMVIRSLNDFDKPGVEFCLRYVEDAEIPLMAFASSYVTSTALPMFLSQAYDAARRLQDNAEPSLVGLRAPSFS